MSFSGWVDRDCLPITGRTSPKAKKDSPCVHVASKDPSDVFQNSYFTVLQLNCMLLVGHKLHFSHICGVGILDCNPRSILLLTDTYGPRVAVNNICSIVSGINA